MEIRLPNLGEDADSGTVASIFVKEGDTVAKDQALIEIESEKAVASVPSTMAGKVTRIHVKEGDEIRVGALIASIGNDSGSDSGQSSSKAARKSKDSAGDPRPARQESREKYELPDGARPAAPPSIRKTARDLGIDLSRVRPSARGGRIVLEDVRKYIVDLQKGTASEPTGKSSPKSSPLRGEPSVDFSRWGPIEVKKASSLRRTIASRMADSWATIPHVMQFGDADITGLMALRKKHVPAYKDRDVKLTLTPILLKALAGVLEKHPLINSSWDAAEGNIVGKEYIHIGVAVDTEAGLLVPVIRDANRKSVLELALEVESLSEGARQRKLGKEQMQGGTFTVSNQGGIGGAHFTPIINKPEAAILGVGRGREVVRMVDGKPEGRIMLPLTLSHDHRIIDGADGVRFLVALIEAFEQFPEHDLEIENSKG
jgi:pyruvate dehydrogenase E2 component (dihydrolipoamide acetyltransferase)